MDVTVTMTAEQYDALRKLLKEGDSAVSGLPSSLSTKIRDRLWNIHNLSKRVANEWN